MGHKRADGIGQALIEYLGGLELAGGDHDGEPFTVLPWEGKFIRGAFGRPGNASLSVARANGKSALVAGIACAVVDPTGPLHGRRREVVIVAASFTQSKIIFEDVRAFLSARYDLSNRNVWRTQDSQNVATIEFRATMARIRCIGSDPSKAHGLRPYLVLADEPSQWDTAKADRMVAALRTSLGKVPNSRMVSLGTRPAVETHWFARALAGVGEGYTQCHAAGENDKPLLVKTWRKANPSLDHLPSLRTEIEAEARDAKKDPALLASFRALRLNGGVSDTEVSTLLDAGTWARIEGEALPGGRPVWGIDLGTSASMSCVAAYWPESGRLETVGAFPSIPSLEERGLRDGVGRLYVECSRQGELVTAGENAVDVSALLGEAIERFGAPSAIAADRWREPELRDALKRARIPLTRLELRGMGFRDGGEDVEGFRRAVGEGRVTPWRSLLLTSSMSEARTMMDPAGNAKLSKKTEGGRRRNARDDAAAAAILSVALGSRRRPKESAAGAYLGAA